MLVKCWANVADVAQHLNNIVQRVVFAVSAIDVEPTLMQHNISWGDFSCWETLPRLLRVANFPAN